MIFYIVIFLLIILLALIICNIAISGNSKSLYRGGLLDSNDITKIHELIKSDLNKYGVLAPDVEEALDVEEAASDVEVLGPDAIVLNKASIPLKKNNGVGNVFFHLVKITDKNKAQWLEFRENLASIIPNRYITKKNFSLGAKKDSITVVSAGFDYINIKTPGDLDITSSLVIQNDTYIAYASIRENNSNMPPNWQDVECMVSFLAQNNIPFYSPVGIFVLPHTVSENSYESIKSNLARSGKPSTLPDYMKSINFSYPSHKSISLTLLTFGATCIQKFYKDKKTALFTSPTDDMTSVIKHGLDKHLLPYGVEINNRYATYERGYIELDTFNNENGYIPKKLTAEDMPSLCPWYCNYNFYLDPDSDNYVNSTPNCYNEVNDNAMVYIPKSSTDALYKTIGFIPI